MKTEVSTTSLLLVLGCVCAQGFFHLRPSKQHGAQRGRSSLLLSMSSSPSNATELLNDLSDSLDNFILTGSPATKEKAASTYREIESQANADDIAMAKRRLQRAGFSMNGLGAADTEQRQQQAEKRKEWEARQIGRSALTQRNPSQKPDVLLGQVDPGLLPLQRMAGSKQLMQDAIAQSNTTGSSVGDDEMVDVSATISELVASAGAASKFQGASLGIGGLDDVLTEVKRRIWTPLAAPPHLLRELGITPVRGLLLYGMPGCGKTLLAQKLGRILSPLRPVTVVSGPEIMDKFVGSSEKNLREIFDNPPDIYEEIRKRKDGDAIANAALHVIVMDEFDAIARNRGGKGGSGDQGDAGVARDSVVNQLLAKMDGVSPLKVPTLVIGLTNKRSLIDTALLRPGRFEVHIEVPPPKTVEQRVSILKVHTKHMLSSGRLLVCDGPRKRIPNRSTLESLPTYDELLADLAQKTDGYSGASLAAISRSAASHALERTVEAFSNGETKMIDDCCVTPSDFAKALEDVGNNSVDDFSLEGDNSENKNNDPS